MIAEAIGLCTLEKKYFLKLIEYTNARSSQNATKILVELIKIKSDIAPKPITEEQRNYYSHWFIPIIGELAALEGFKPDAEWISNTILPEISPKQVEECLEILTRVGVLATDPTTGKIVRTKSDLSTADEVPDQDVSRYHREIIDLGKSALSRIPRNEREISSVTISASEAVFNKIKTMIQEFENQVLLEEREAKEKDRVCQLNIQFFPVTKKVRKS